MPILPKARRATAVNRGGAESNQVTGHRRISCFPLRLGARGVGVHCQHVGGLSRADAVLTGLMLPGDLHQHLAGFDAYVRR